MTWSGICPVPIVLVQVIDAADSGYYVRVIGDDHALAVVPYSFMVKVSSKDC